MTAVTVTAENGHTIAFLGTSDGRILKVLLQAERLLKGPADHDIPILTDCLDVHRYTLLQMALLQNTALSQ